MLSRLIRGIYGDISDAEIKKFGLLSLTFFFTIGAYWLLRPLKDAIFAGTVGIEFQPKAKILSLFVVVPLVLIYTKLVDLFEKHKLFYIIGGTYAVLFFIIAFFLGHPTIGLPNVELGFYRWIGWLTYVSIESFGSIIVALFWSFVASITTSESAKKGFPIVIAGAQVGGIIGPCLALNAERIGVQNLFYIAGFFPLIMIYMVWHFMKVTPADQLVSTKQDVANKKPKTGFMEGLNLLLTRPYLFGIFAIVSLYEIVSTIIDYQMKVQAKALPEYATTAGFAKFLGIFGVGTNGVALLMALLGTSYMMRRFGLIFCLLAFPSTVAISLAGLYYRASIPGMSPSALLWSTFTVMIVAKGLSYALNNPAKEMMYIPTSKDAKFKSKGWIDMFGSRFSKMGGSFINDPLKEVVKSQGMVSFMLMGTVISLGLIGIWIAFALFVGRKFVSLTKEGKIVE